MKYIYDNIGKYDPEIIRTDCFQRFDESVIVKQLMDIYIKVICKK